MVNKYNNLFIRIFDFLIIAWQVAAAGLAAAFAVWWLGLRKRKKLAKWEKILYRTVIAVLVVGSLLVIAAKLYIPTMFGA